ncbi:MAG TPA: type II toxin-antitoxin system VapC family toxin [Candidatus Lustribacter sp.]
MITIDASIAVAWFLDSGNPSAGAALAALEAADGIAPSNLITEIAQALVRAQRQKRFSDDDLVRASEELAALPIQFVSPTFSELVVLSKRHSISAYDAAYLAAAIATSAPLVTLDERLARAAAAERILWLPKPSRRGMKKKRV